MKVAYSLANAEKMRERTAGSKLPGTDPRWQPGRTPGIQPAKPPLMLAGGLRAAGFLGFGAAAGYWRNQAARLLSRYLPAVAS